MGLIRVSPLELRQRANMLAEANHSVRAKVDEFELSCHALAGQWEGEARDAFVNAYTQDKAQMENFIRVMDGYYQALLSVAENYEKAECRNAGIATNRSYNGGGWSSIGDIVSGHGVGPVSTGVPIVADISNTIQ